jgi:chemotaxis protein methyltransferase CheR
MEEKLVDSFVNHETFRKIVSYLQEHKHILLSSFKDGYLKRRLYLRAVSLKLGNIEDYYKYITMSNDEVKKFENTLTINVSYFFRNPETFDTIRREVLPEIFLRKKETRDKFVKILSIGCASGEEPYSMAIILKEFFHAEIQQYKTYILGVDFDYDSIVQGRLGVFDEQRLVYVPEVLKKKYFGIIEHKKYMLNSEIRSMVVLRQEDIFKESIRRFWDIVLCRNMLIYINPESQEDLLSKVLVACLDGSYLILGKSESICGKVRKFFAPVFIKERIFVKRRNYES